MLTRAEEPPGRSQSVHRSDDAPVIGAEQRDAGKGRRDATTTGHHPGASALRGYASRTDATPLGVGRPGGVDATDAHGARHGRPRRGLV